MSIKHLVAIFLFLLIMLSSCTRKPSAILDDTTCEAPCWKGIVPGISTIQEVEVLVSSLPDIEIGSPPEKTGSTNPFLEKGMDWKFTNVVEYRGEVYFRNDRVTFINFSSLNQLVLSDFIDKFGEPSIVFIKSTKGDPAVYLTVELIYEDSGICLSHQPSLIFPFDNPESYRIKPSLKIGNVRFINPLLPNGQLLSGCLAGLDEITYQAHQQAWKGYGEYDVFIWD